MTEQKIMLKVGKNESGTQQIQDNLKMFFLFFSI